ncbi:MAG: HNH endonuclease, partial [Bdellovibrio sp.]
TITFSKEQMAVLKQAQDLIAHAVPEKNWAKAITYLAQKEVDRRTQSRTGKFQPSGNKSTPAAGVTDESHSVGKIPSRKMLFSATKKIILLRDKCCQYKDNITGKVCGSTRFLQTDHRQSVWAGGDNSIDNLQILCAQHNQHKYQREASLRS